jgi:Multicopper oxidase
MTGPGSRIARSARCSSQARCADRVGIQPPDLPSGAASARQILSRHGFRRLYQTAIHRAQGDPRASATSWAPDLRHGFSTWLEDEGIPARVIDEPRGHQRSRRGELEGGSRIGARYRHTTPEMAAQGHASGQLPRNARPPGRRLARDGVAEPNLVWKDTVLVRTGPTVDVLFDVTNPGLWMAHLPHGRAHAERHDVQLQRRPDSADLMSGYRGTMPGRGGWLWGRAEPLVRREHSAGHRIA